MVVAASARRLCSSRSSLASFACSTTFCDWLVCKEENILMSCAKLIDYKPPSSRGIALFLAIFAYQKNGLNFSRDVAQTPSCAMFAEQIWGILRPVLDAMG